MKVPPHGRCCVGRHGNVRIVVSLFVVGGVGASLGLRVRWAIEKLFVEFETSYIRDQCGNDRHLEFSIMTLARLLRRWWM